MMIDTSINEQLMEMGFTALEADIYLYLLIHGQQTGYAIAKGTSKPTANVYKALESLAAKGAIESSNSNKKSYIALDWQLLLNRRQAHFEDTLTQLKHNLSNLQRKQSSDEQVYQIEHVEQVIEQTVFLIDNAQAKLMIDIEPEALPYFEESIKEANRRGVEIWMKVYQPIEIEGVNVILRDNGQQIYAKSASTSYKLAADGNAMLMADVCFEERKVVQAFRSQSALMAFSIYSALLYEIVLTELKQVIPGDDLAAAKNILDRTAHLHPISTENEVFEHYQKTYEPNKGE